MAISKTLNVNGERVTTTIDDPDMPLLYLLRGNLGLQGPRFGCGLAQCGACTVHLDGQAVRSCVLPLSAIGENSKVVTLEGLGTPENLHPVQRAFIQEQAAQCGYCINGMIMQAAAFLAGSPKPSEADVKNALAANLCRCSTRRRRARGDARRRRRAREAMMGKPFIPSRRDILKTGGALVVSFSFGGPAREALAEDAVAPKPVALTAVDSFVAINSAGAVTIYSGKVDLGTGVRTALTQIAAEEKSSMCR